MPAATSEWQSSSRTPHASCVAPHASLVPSHASPCSPFVTGLVDKCEAAMAATDALCASAAARVHFNCTTPCRVTVNTNAERCREVRGTRPRDSLDWEDALQRSLGM